MAFVPNARFSMLVLAVGTMSSSTSSPPRCRCTQPACLATVPFDTLNASVGGRLVRVMDEVSACVGRGINSRECEVGDELMRVITRGESMNMLDECGYDRERTR